MSDVMPYRSSRFSALNPRQIEAYRDAWLRHLRDVIAETRPDVIHSHHVWLLSSVLRDVAPETPIRT